MSISNKLKYYRKKNNITQTDLAKRAGVSRQSIYAVEAQKSEPSLELAFRLSSILNVNITELFIWSVEDKEGNSTIPPFSIF